MIILIEIIKDLFKFLRSIISYLVRIIIISLIIGSVFEYVFRLSEIFTGSECKIPCYMLFGSFTLLWIFLSYIIIEYIYEFFCRFIKSFEIKKQSTNYVMHKYV
jgi:uncharacterized membrane protein